MKLFELYADLDALQDPLQFRDNEDAHDSPVDKRYVDAELKPKSPSRSSNVVKAKRIANLVKNHKRSSNPEDSETPFQSNLGGHGSTWLNR